MQGKRFTEEKVLRVQYLLAKTEMTIHEIALRTGASESSIAAINRRFDVRRYNGKRARWEMGSAPIVESSISLRVSTTSVATADDLSERRMELSSGGRPDLCARRT
jgi:hypothetical protein